MATVYGVQQKKHTMEEKRQIYRYQGINNTFVFHMLDHHHFHHQVVPCECSIANVRFVCAFYCCCCFCSFHRYTTDRFVVAFAHLLIWWSRDVATFGVLFHTQYTYYSQKLFIIYSIFFGVLNSNADIPIYWYSICSVHCLLSMSWCLVFRWMCHFACMLCPKHISPMTINDRKNADLTRANHFDTEQRVKSDQMRTPAWISFIYVEYPSVFSCFWKSSESTVDRVTLIGNAHYTAHWYSQIWHENRFRNLKIIVIVGNPLLRNQMKSMLISSSRVKDDLCLLLSRSSHFVIFMSAFVM